MGSRWTFGEDNQLLLSKGSGVVHGEGEEVKDIFPEVSHRNGFICSVSSISLIHITPVCIKVFMLLQSPVRNCLVIGRFISVHRFLSFWPWSVNFHFFGPEVRQNIGEQGLGSM